MIQTESKKGDPQWPQAFYPTDELYDLKDGDSIIGRCSYRNDENRIVYAGSTHNDEMCNVYLMYYTDDIKDVMDTCSGNTYPQLESILPAESIQKPLKPSTFSKNNKDDNIKIDSILSHHDMEGSKLHDSNPKQSSSKSLSYFLSQSDLNADDYYDDVERSRGKNRGKDPASYDYDPSLDTVNNNDNGEDYSSLSDAASSSLLLAAALDKINGKINKNNNLDKINKINNQVINKMKNQLNNFLPKTVTSKLRKLWLFLYFFLMLSILVI